MDESERDVSKALAAFGAPPLKYRSFSHAPIPTAPTPVDLPPAPPSLARVTPPPPPPPPTLRHVLPASDSTRSGIGEMSTPSLHATSLPELTAPEMMAPDAFLAARTPGTASPMTVAPPVRLSGPNDLPLVELFRILSSVAPDASRMP